MPLSLTQMVDQHTRQSLPHQGNHITFCTHRYISKYTASLLGTRKDVWRTRPITLGLADCRAPWNVIHYFKFALLSSVRASTRDCKPMFDQHHLSFHNLQTAQDYVAYHASFLCCLKVLSRHTASRCTLQMEWQPLYVAQAANYMQAACQLGADTDALTVHGPQHALATHFTKPWCHAMRRCMVTVGMIYIHGHRANKVVKCLHLYCIRCVPCPGRLAGPQARR
jgi:hypothetical protein